MKVLIAIDDSRYSLAAMESVADRLWPDGTEFKLITVREPMFAQYAYGGMYVVESMVAADHQFTEHCRKYVEDKVSQLRTMVGHDRVTGTVLEGGIAESIIDTAKDWEADLIVVGSHGRKGFQKFLLGSVAERVATHAPCSIEIVKEKQVHTDKQQTADKQKVLVAPVKSRSEKL